MTLTKLPASLQLNIMQRLTDGRDLLSLGQVCLELETLTEDRLLWKKLCQYHFTDRQVGWDESDDETVVAKDWPPQSFEDTFLLGNIKTRKYRFLKR